MGILSFRLLCTADLLRDGADGKGGGIAGCRHVAGSLSCGKVNVAGAREKVGCLAPTSFLLPTCNLNPAVVYKFCQATGVILSGDCHALPFNHQLLATASTQILDQSLDLPWRPSLSWFHDHSLPLRSKMTGAMPLSLNPLMQPRCVSSINGKTSQMRSCKPVP